jgi:hypothetical protein
VQRQRDEVREERIFAEIVVDAHDEDEQAMSWYNYLGDPLSFPYIAHCGVRRAIFPLQVGDEVDVIRTAPEEECRHEMFVMIRLERDGSGTRQRRSNSACYTPSEVTPHPTARSEESRSWSTTRTRRSLGSPRLRGVLHPRWPLPVANGAPPTSQRLALRGGRRALPHVLRPAPGPSTVPTYHASSVRPYPASIRIGARR